MRSLTDHGLRDPPAGYYGKRQVQYRRGRDDRKDTDTEENTMGIDKKDFKKASGAVVIKLEKKGDIASGKFISLEESKMYSGSYALKFDDGQVKVCFVNSIGKDLITENGVKQGDDFILEHNGCQKAKTSGMEYHTYNLYYKA
jgi:hypothetical protein